MQKKLSDLNQDIMHGKIGYQLSQIVSGKLSYQEAMKALDEVETMLNMVDQQAFRATVDGIRTSLVARYHDANFAKENI